MLKFIVVLYRKQGTAAADFRGYFQRTHGPLAEALPGMRRYVQNFAVADPRRPHPGWDAVIEMGFDDREAMEAAWASPAGKAATGDLAVFVDLERSSWSVVEAVVHR